MSTRGVLSGLPVLVVEPDAPDAALGAVVREALGASLRGRAERGSADHELARLGITWAELDKAPGVSVNADGRGFSLSGWRPSQLHSGREPAGVDDIELDAPSDAALGHRVRALLELLGDGLPAPKYAASSFGFKTCWLAASGVTTAGFADAIGLSEAERVTWEAGVPRATQESELVFVTPEVEGWIFAVGVDWFDEADFVAHLSGELGAPVQYFASHRVPDAYIWARAEAGELTRAAGYVGERGEAFGEGKPTDVERRLGFDWVLPRWSEAPEQDAYPDELAIAEVAGAWSLNPLTLDRVESSPDPGLLGRPERLLG